MSWLRLPRLKFSIRRRRADGCEPYPQGRDSRLTSPERRQAQKRNRGKCAKVSHAVHDNFSCVSDLSFTRELPTIVETGESQMSSMAATPVKAPAPTPSPQQPACSPSGPNTVCGLSGTPDIESALTGAHEVVKSLPDLPQLQRTPKRYTHKLATLQTSAEQVAYSCSNEHGSEEDVAPFSRPQAMPAQVEEFLWRATHSRGSSSKSGSLAMSQPTRIPSAANTPTKPRASSDAAHIATPDLLADPTPPGQNVCKSSRIPRSSMLRASQADASPRNSLDATTAESTATRDQGAAHYDACALEDYLSPPPRSVSPGFSKLSEFSKMSAGFTPRSPERRGRSRDRKTLYFEHEVASPPVDIESVGEAWTHGGIGEPCTPQRQTKERPWHLQIPQTPASCSSSVRSLDRRGSQAFEERFLNWYRTVTPQQKLTRSIDAAVADLMAESQGDARSSRSVSLRESVEMTKTWHPQSMRASDKQVGQTIRLESLVAAPDDM